MPGSESEQHEHRISFRAGELCVGFHRFCFDLPVSFGGFSQECGIPLVQKMA